MDVEVPNAHLVASLSTGQRIRMRREARGMSRPVLAGLVGRSADWLKKIENGDWPVNSLKILVELARNLDVRDISELTGNDLCAPVRAWEKDIHPVVPAVRLALREVSFGQSSSSSALPRLDAADLDREVQRLWMLWHR